MADQANADHQLVKLVQQGHTKAFDLLVVKYQHRVAAVVRKFIQDPDDVADVTQEAFIKAYRALSGFRMESAFYTWLYRIAVNAAKNHLMTAGKKGHLYSLDVDDLTGFESDHQLTDDATPEANLATSRLHQEVKAAIAKLPADLKMALTLREFDGLSYEDIAEAMNTPIGTVRSRISRAREAVDKHIADHIMVR